MWEYTMVFNMILTWLAFLPTKFFLSILKYPLAPIGVLFFSTPNKRQLKGIFYWLETWDNDLSGDEGWKTEHIKPGSNPLSNWNRIKWLWRNGFNRVNYEILGVPMMEGFNKINSPFQDSKNFWSRPDGAWQFRARIKIPFINRFWTPYVGWGLFGTHKLYCKYSATIFRFNSK